VIVAAGQDEHTDRFGGGRSDGCKQKQEEQHEPILSSSAHGVNRINNLRYNPRREAGE
jgi:hypothetical protein